MGFKKIIISAVLVLLLGYSLIMPASAATHEPHDGTVQTVGVARAEETKWYYRVNNGVMEKRLWSITYGVWLTDWMPVE